MQALPSVAVLKVPSLQEQNITKLQALTLATKSFSRAIQIQPQNVSCWQDLALSFHYRGLNSQALQALKKALALSPKDHTLWNILGVFAIKQQDFALAQHAFIRSISLNGNAMAWSNLGILYYIKGNFSFC